MSLSRILAILTGIMGASCETPGIWKGDLVRPTKHVTMKLKSFGPGQLQGNAPLRGVLEQTENRTNGQVGRTVWQIAFREPTADKTVPLFCVERIQAEKSPGPPIFEMPWDEPILRDAAGTYIYSIPGRRFLENHAPESVYAGSYRTYSGSPR